MDAFFTLNVKKFFVILAIIVAIWGFLISYHKSFGGDIILYIWIIPLLLSLGVIGFSSKFLLEI
jgi:hypothetical protein